MQERLFKEVSLKHTLTHTLQPFLKAFTPCQLPSFPYTYNLPQIFSHLLILTNCPLELVSFFIHHKKSFSCKRLAVALTYPPCLTFSLPRPWASHRLPPSTCNAGLLFKALHDSAFYISNSLFSFSLLVMPASSAHLRDLGTNDVSESFPYIYFFGRGSLICFRCFLKSLYHLSSL